MTLANKLGKSYEKNREKAKIKTITLEIGNAKFDLKVRVPLKKEMELMIEKITKPSEEIINVIYERLAAPLIKTVNEGGEEFKKALEDNDNSVVILENDVLLQGRSVKEVATLTAMWETKVEEYFHLLESETGEPINESYEQIAEEFPESVIKQIIEDIESSIKPDYKSTKKN